MIATPSPVEQAHADVEGGDMCPAKDRRSIESGTDERPSIGKERLFWGLCPQGPWDFTALMPIPVD